MKAVVFVGAGLSKALERKDYPIPLMWDFVRVAAFYANTDDVLLTTLTQLETSGLFVHSTNESKALASRIAPPSVSTNEERTAFLRILTSRPDENIEHLLIRAEGMKKNSVGLPLTDRLTIETLPLRFSFAINRLFYLIEWNVKKRWLVRFCQRLLRRYSSITFVTFNYDLILEHAVEDATSGTWAAATGYGVPFVEFVNADEANAHMSHLGVMGSGGAVGVLRSYATAPNFRECPVKILKPHGSLDWLCQFSGNYNFVGLPTHLTLTTSKRVAYINSANVEFLERPGPHPWPNAGVFIFPPTLKLPVQTILDQEEDSLVHADDAFVVGWSAPATDTDQIALIKNAIARRSRPFRRVAIIDRTKSRQHYARFSKLFRPYDSFAAWPFGFSAYVGCFLRTMLGRGVGLACAWPP